MPTYVYQCDTCGMQFERRQRITDDPLSDCPECDGHVKREMQPVGIVFKGSGWYCTDNRAKSPTAMSGESKTKEAGKNGGDKKSTSSGGEKVGNTASTSSGEEN